MISSVACAASSLGFLQATLEPHLRDFNLKPIIIGSMFVVSGGVYGKRKYSENIFQKKNEYSQFNFRFLCTMLGHGL